MSSQLEIRQDITRERFLVEYINAYVRLLKDNVFIVDDMKEFNLNIQMMVYAQIWESHRLIKTILRIAKILAGEPYEWKIPFEYVDCNGKTKSYQKAKIWEDRILKYLNNVNTNLAKFIKENYDSKLRNDFAHASYYIDIDNNSISFLDSERYSKKGMIDICDWEQMFIYSVSFSYHLIRKIKERCDNFIKDYPELTFVTINCPSYKTPGELHKISIYPYETVNGVAFNFITCNRPKQRIARK